MNLLYDMSTISPSVNLSMGDNNEEEELEGEEMQPFGKKSNTTTTTDINGSKKGFKVGDFSQKKTDLNTSTEQNPTGKTCINSLVILAW